MTHAALQYILAYPAVSTIILGPKSVEQTRDNFAAANHKLPDEVVREIHALRENEIQDDRLPW